MKYLIIISILFLTLAITAQSSWEEIIKQKSPADIPISANLYQLGKYYHIDPADAVKKAYMMGLEVRSGDRLMVEIVRGRNINLNIDTTSLKRIGVDINTTWRNRVNASVGLRDVISIAKQLPSGYNMEPVHEPIYLDQGPAMINSESYISAGYGGAGIKIAVIDGGYQNFALAESAGTVPDATHRKIYLMGRDILENGNNHGTKCLEALYDHAPDAFYYIFATKGQTNWGRAIDTCIANGVNIISISTMSLGQGWDDGTGPTNASVSLATDAGILVFTAAGNFTQHHWQGSYWDANFNNIHEWSGFDENNDITVHAGKYTEIYIQWDSNMDCYDMELVKSSDLTLLASGADHHGYEKIVWTNPDTINPAGAFIRVREGGDVCQPEFEVFSFRQELEHKVAESSVGGPANSLEDNCISVGAIDWADFDTLPGTYGIIQGYSSRGPTNNGNLAPEITSVTNTFTISNISPTNPNGVAGGTSNATPNAAGAAAAFWSAHPHYSADGVRQVILRKAALYKDFGDSGPDNTYGHGGIYLYDYFYNTQYIYRSGNNVTASPALPWYDMEQVDLHAPANGRAVFLGETYPVPSGIISKNMLYVSLIEDALIR